MRAALLLLAVIFFAGGAPELTFIALIAIPLVNVLDRPSGKRCALHGYHRSQLCPGCGRVRARYIEGGGDE